LSVWFVLPSARPHPEAEPILSLWRNRGYRIGLWRDPGTEEHFQECLIIRKYQGYAHAVNALVNTVLEVDPECSWIVTGGDDTTPDPNHTAQEIAEQLAAHFGGTFGCCQPIADDWGHDRNAHAYSPNTAGRCIQCGQGKDAARHMTGSYISRVAGSPWMGREFCQRINQGTGPLHEGYFHCGSDEELQAIAIKYGCFLQRPDLLHNHLHWGRAKPGEAMGHQSDMPDFLKRANSAAEWNKYKALFAQREAAGFPGSEPL
jgi:hypothetical protein